MSLSIGKARDHVWEFGNCLNHMLCHKATCAQTADECCWALAAEASRLAELPKQLYPPWESCSSFVYIKPKRILKLLFLLRF